MKRKRVRTPEQLAHNREYGKQYRIDHLIQEKERHRLDYLKNRDKKIAYQKKHRPITKENELKRAYGLLPGEYQELLNSQKGCCAICGRHQKEFKKSLFVDHDHATKKIRALLCPDCNLALGYAKDSIDLLQKMIGYLSYYKFNGDLK